MSTNPTALWDLPPQAHMWPHEYGRVLLERTDSTMAEARRRIGDNVGPMWILAREQTDAHGRRGRSWSNPIGNFAATLLLPLRCSAQTAALRSFVAALALRDAIKAVAPNANTSLKWPNDVLVDGDKIAGILLESGGTGGNVDWLSIGVGVNLLHGPEQSALEERAHKATSLVACTGVSVSPEDFLFWLACHFAEHEKMFRTFGFEPIRNAWMASAAKIGQEITVRTTRDELVGTFDDIDEGGNLVLSTAKGRHVIPAADIYF